MIPRWQAFGFWLAALGVLLAATLPLSSHMVPALAARPVQLAGVVAAG